MRTSRLPRLGQYVVWTSYKRRHDSPFARAMARATIRDAKLWKGMHRGR